MKFQQIKSILIAIVFAISSSIVGQNIPTYGSLTNLDIANWNIEWFGDASNGPSNDALQFTNVKTVIQKAGIDVWGLSEIANDAMFYKLADSIKNFKGVLAPYGVTQKTAMLFDTTLFTLLHSKVILTSFTYDFAGGRYPFEVALKSKFSNDSFIFIVVHLKANTGNSTDKLEALNRRAAASGHIKTYIDQTYPNLRVMVLGDFNDDTDVSIYSSKPTPFANFLQDPNNYKFLTVPLSANKTSSTTSYTEMIDHQLVSNEFNNNYIANSCKVLKLNTYITSYSSNTSDHYPVYSTFIMNKTVNTLPIVNHQYQLYPNPISDVALLQLPQNSSLIKIYDINGKEYSSQERLKNGCYILQFQIENNQYFSKFILSNID